MFFRCPNNQAHCNEAVLCLNFETPENNEFIIFRCPNTFKSTLGIHAISSYCQSVSLVPNFCEI